MNRTDRIIKILMYVLGGLATIGFVITKSSVALAWVTSGDYRYGDLYRFSKIGRFKPPAPLPEGKFGNEDSFDQGKQEPNQEDSILLGDSFSFCDFGETPFHMQLQQKLGGSIFSVGNHHHGSFWENPYLLLESQTNRTRVQRVLVYEIVERSIPWQFANPISTKELAQGRTKASFVRSLWGEFRNSMFLNSETRHETLLKHGIVTSAAIGFWNTAVFELFRQMPGETPLYSLKPPFLFYQDEVACFQSVHDEKLVAKLADNIALLDRNLQERFGCTLVFVPIPDKISLYSRYAFDKPYDDFLPHLCSALKTRGVRTVELLPLFQKQNELLYWPTDTHWNNHGIRIAVEQTLKNWP